MTIKVTEQPENCFTFLYYGVVYEIKLEKDENIFENISCSIFILSIFSNKKETVNIYSNEKIANQIRDTIGQILSIYLKMNCCIIWLCDNSDEKELLRNRLFNRWYYCFTEQEHEKIDRYNIDSRIYASLVIRKDNINYIEILRQFDELTKMLGRIV